MVNGLSDNELKEFLDSKYLQYNQKKFIESDPIQVPHNFTSKERYRNIFLFNCNNCLGAEKNYY